MAMTADLYPMFPNVRCANCDLAYTVVTDTDRGSKVIVGQCPRCDSERFNTTLVEETSR